MLYVLTYWVEDSAGEDSRLEVVASAPKFTTTTTGAPVLPEGLGAFGIEYGHGLGAAWCDVSVLDPVRVERDGSRSGGGRYPLGVSWNLAYMRRCMARVGAVAQ